MCNLEHKTLKFKKLMGKVFEMYCETGLYTLKCDFLGLLTEDLGHFGALELLESSGFGCFNVHVKSTYSNTSKRNSFSIEVIVHVMGN